MKALWVSGIVIVLLAAGFVTYLLLPRSPADTPAESTFPSTPGSTEVFVPPEQSANALKTPDGFAVGFYTWYLSGVAADPLFSVSARFTADLPQWLTPTFAAQYRALASSTQEDPALLAQDFLPSWPSTIRATVAAQTAAESDVLVLLGTSAELKKLGVHLTRESGEWRISSISLSN